MDATKPKIAPTPSPSPSPSHSPLVELVVRPCSTYGMKGLVTTAEVLFTIKTGELDNTKNQRPPVNLSIVLDRSGSMDGEKFSNAIASIKSIVNNLQDQDLFHMVMYGSDVEVVFENIHPSDKETIIRKLDCLQTNGCTNLSGGISQGSELLHKHQQAGYNPRMFLFSDGLANEGIRDKGELNKMVQKIHRDHQIKIDSFGIGDDFDSEMMKNIAEYGGGEFYFIANAEAIQKLVHRAMEGLLSLVGTDTVLKIRGKGNCNVKKIFGHADIVSGARLGDLHQKNSRMILCEVEVHPNNDLNEQEIISYELSYVPCADSKSFQEKKDVITGVVSLKLTENEDEVKGHQNQQVLVQSAIQQAAEMDDHIRTLIKQGNSKGALELQTKQISLLKSVVDLDSTKMAASLLTIALQGEEKLKQQGASKEMEHHYSHGGYMKRRGSMSYVTGYL